MNRELLETITPPRANRSFGVFSRRAARRCIIPRTHMDMVILKLSALSKITDIKSIAELEIEKNSERVGELKDFYEMDISLGFHPIPFLPIENRLPYLFSSWMSEGNPKETGRREKNILSPVE